MKVQVLVGIGVIVLILSVPTNAFAPSHPIFVPPPDTEIAPTSSFSFGSIIWIAQDFIEEFVGIFSVDWKNEVRANHIVKLQSDYERTRDTSTLGRIKEKIKALMESDNELSGLEKLSNTVIASAELGKINAYYNEFLGLYNQGITTGQHVRILEMKINSLQVADHCSYIIVKELLESVDPFLKLKSFCPDLEGVSDSMALSMINGAG